MYFHEYFVDFDGDFGAFDERGSYNLFLISAPHFLFFLSARGA